jgi:hypothetical protein
MADTPFPGGSGITPNLLPNPPLDMPDAPGPGDATASLSPFTEPQDVDSIIAQLTLDRPLKLYIPNKERYAGWEFRIINSIPQEIADAHNKGFRQVTDPELSVLFDSLVAGTDKEGKAFRPLLFARSSTVGEHVRKQNRKKLQSLYAGMDPKLKDLSGKYTDNASGQDGARTQFTGPAFRIRV